MCNFQVLACGKLCGKLSKFVLRQGFKNLIKSSENSKSLWKTVKIRGKKIFSNTKR
jgi:hypothetical protein